jgi:hypothetical protein
VISQACSEVGVRVGDRGHERRLKELAEPLAADAGPAERALERRVEGGQVEECLVDVEHADPCHRGVTSAVSISPAVIGYRLATVAKSLVSHCRQGRVAGASAEALALGRSSGRGGDQGWIGQRKSS